MLALDGAGALSAGLMLGTASILSVGPNNLMLVREGLTRGHVGLVAALVWTSYLALLVIAFLLADCMADGLSGARTLLTWLGPIALTWFAAASLRAALRREPVRDPATTPRESRRACLRRVLAVVWLNPLTYVELLLVPAALCGRFSGQEPRLEFILGLLSVAAVCCCGYAFGGGACIRVLRDGRALRAFDLSAGLLLATATVLLTYGLLAEVG